MSRLGRLLIVSHHTELGVDQVLIKIMNNVDIQQNHGTPLVEVLNCDIVCSELGFRKMSMCISWQVLNRDIVKCFCAVYSKHIIAFF